MNYIQRATELKDEMIQNRRYLHQHPELGFELSQTCRFVWDKLEEMGYDPQMCGRSGITATVGYRPGGGVILLRADMDALPMREENGLPFASTVDRAHTCGHDMHTAMLLGAAKMLKENEDNLPGTVKLMFQPAEEILEGAKSMIQSGILENPPVDAAMGAHMLPLAPTGMIGYNTGTVSASSDTIGITIHGKGGHGAQPNTAIDPINVAAHLHISLQELISREVDPSETVVLTFGAIQAGKAHNIIPETASMKGTLRTYNKEVREFMLRRLEEVTEYTARTFRARGEVNILASTVPMVVDPGTADIIAPALTELLGERVVKLDQRADGSEDFAEICERVPGMFFVVGGGSREEGYEYGLHNPKVRFNEDALPYGAAAYAQGATAWLDAQSEPETELAFRLSDQVLEMMAQYNTEAGEDFF